MKRKILLISDKREPELSRALNAEGLIWDMATPEETASLTAAISESNATDLILLGPCPWSLAHVLAAAKQLQGKGRLILMGDLPSGYKPLQLLHRVESRSEAVMLLDLPPEQPKRRPAALFSPQNKKPTSGSGTGGSSGTGIRPMRIPPELILMVAVAGSQSRIGCTTEALAAWHYCKALGFAPAVQMASEQLNLISAALSGTRIPGGWQIQGIPCVEETALSYDCYIQDLGALTEANAQAFLAADYRLLVAGSKAWELPATARAVVLGDLRASKNAGLLLSFSIGKGLEQFRELGCPIALAPWQPEPWEAVPEALVCLDKLLRPGLEEMVRQPVPEPE